MLEFWLTIYVFTALPLVEVKPLAEEQKLDVAFLEVVACLGHFGALRVLGDTGEVHLLLLQVVA